MESAPCSWWRRLWAAGCGSCFHVVWNQEREAAGLDQKMSEDTSSSVKVSVEALKLLIEADRKGRSKWWLIFEKDARKFPETHLLIPIDKFT